MDGVVEVITGRERRRRWSTSFKLRVVAELQEPGAQVRAVAARRAVCESLVFTWRRQVREGVLTEPELPVFLSVQVFEASLLSPAPAVPSRPELPVVSAPSPVMPPAPAPPRPQAGLIEIELGDGRRLRVGADVNLAALSACWRRCAGDPGCQQRADLAGNGPHGHAARHAGPGAARAGGVRPGPIHGRRLCVQGPQRFAAQGALA